jgi:hypothetical protein
MGLVGRKGEASCGHYPGLDICNPQAFIPLGNRTIRAG